MFFVYGATVVFCGWVAIPQQNESKRVRVLRLVFAIVWFVLVIGFAVFGLARTASAKSFTRTGSISGYYLKKNSVNCWKDCRVFRDGTKVSSEHVGKVAACPVEFLGYTVEVTIAGTSYKRRCRDTGGAITGKNGNPCVDFLMISHQEVLDLKWAARNRKTNKDRADHVCTYTEDK